jgi:hypothetical protein
MCTTRNIQNRRDLIDNDLPISVPELVNASFALRPTAGCRARAGMPVIRIGKRAFVRFSDLTNADSREP